MTESFAPPVAPVAPIPADATAADESGITCAVCGTHNDPLREFCRKCASPLRPTTTVVKSNDTLKFIATFVLTSAIGVAVVVGGAALLRPQATRAASIQLTSGDRPEVDVGLTADAPKPLEALPASATIQLASFKVPGTSGTPGERVQPPWWNDAVPRVPAVSQFDGGPLQTVNCVMAAGAMLARLGYGIVTTGSQLRALQDDQSGATNYADLKAAVARGWGVRLFTGDLSAIQLRALLWAGAGVEVGIVYGALPVADRLQESFTGNHSIYIDAFRPFGADGPAAYYVMDPIGHTWAGYRGEWLPAADIERAAEAHSAGKISAAWAFAGGVVPADHKVLPPSAYPGAPGSGESPAPTSGPGASGGPIIDPLPLGDLPLGSDPPNGDPPPDTPKFPHLQFVKDAFLINPGPGLPTCSVVPAPAGCPQGILGIIDLGGATILTASSPPSNAVDLLYANLISPGTYQIVFSAPAGTDANLWLWGTSGGALQAATVEAGYIGGEPVSVATVSLDTTAGYSFVATASGAGVQAISSVGTVSAQP